MTATILTPAQRNRLVELLDLMDDTRVCQLDTEELREFRSLLDQLTEVSP